MPYRRTPSTAGSGAYEAVRVAPLASGDTTGATDRAAIQAVLTAAGNAGGGKVIVLPGTYYAYGLRVPGNVEFCGQRGAVLKLPDGTPQNIIEVVNVSNVEIHHLELDGNRVNQTNQSDAVQCNINAWGVNGFEVHHVNSHDAYAHGVFVRDTASNSNVSIHHNTLHDNGYRPVHIHGNPTTTIRNVVVESNIVYGNGVGNVTNLSGIFVAFQNAKGIAVNNNIVHDEVGLGLAVMGQNDGSSPVTEQVTVVGNVVRACGGGGLLIDDGIKRVTVTGNIFAENGSGGSGHATVAIIADTTNANTFPLQELIFTDNQILDSGGYGLQIGIASTTYLLKQARISGNVISGSFSDGIHAFATGDWENVSITNNVLRGNGGWAISLAATGHTVRALDISHNQSKFNISGFLSLTGVPSFDVFKNASVDDTTASAGNNTVISVVGSTGKVTRNTITVAERTNSGTAIVTDTTSTNVDVADNDVTGLTGAAPVTQGAVGGVVGAPAIFTAPWMAGRYYMTPNLTSTSASATLGIGTWRGMPCYIPNRCTLTRIGAEVTVVGDAGSKVRLGIYADDGTGLPGKLVLDAGTINGDSNTVQEITISQALAPGLYWFGAAVQVVTTTQPTLRTWAGGPYVPVSFGTTMPTANATIMGQVMGSVTGALPASYTNNGTTGSIPRVFVKVGTTP